MPVPRSASVADTPIVLGGTLPISQRCYYQHHILCGAQLTRNAPTDANCECVCHIARVNPAPLLKG